MHLVTNHGKSKIREGDLAVNRRTKFVLVTGGVVSSIGKGLASASIGALMEARGLRVTHMKLDPYINVDPGTMSPYSARGGLRHR